MRNQKERDTKTQGYVPDPPRGHPPAGQDLPTTQRVWRVMTVTTPTKKLHGLPPSAQLQGTASSIQRSPYMSLRADRYRQRAAEAENCAAQTSNPSIKSAFEEVARGWLLLAEQTEWIERQRSSRRDEHTSN
jgi:hypothetical protein